MKITPRTRTDFRPRAEQWTVGDKTYSSAQEVQDAYSASETDVPATYTPHSPLHNGRRDGANRYMRTMSGAYTGIMAGALICGVAGLVLEKGFGIHTTPEDLGPLLGLVVAGGAMAARFTANPPAPPEFKGTLRNLDLNNDGKKETVFVLGNQAIELNKHQNSMTANNQKELDANGPWWCNYNQGIHQGLLSTMADKLFGN